MNDNLCDTCLSGPIPWMGKFIYGANLSHIVIEMILFQVFLWPATHKPLFDESANLPRPMVWLVTRCWFRCQLARQVRSDAASSHDCQEHNATALRYYDIDGCCHGLTGGCLMPSDGRDNF